MAISQFAGVKFSMGDYQRDAIAEETASDLQPGKVQYSDSVERAAQ